MVHARHIQLVKIRLQRGLPLAARVEPSLTDRFYFGHFTQFAIGSLNNVGSVRKIRFDKAIVAISLRRVSST